MKDIFDFDPESKIKAFDFLFQEYFKAGFGTLTKSDIDLLFFSALLGYGKIKDDSDYSLSKSLQITQSRVRNLKIKNGLKYAPFDRARIEAAFLNKASFARLEEDGKRISLPIYDPNLYIELENLIEKENGYVEAQLNPKIFTIRIDQFFSLLINIQAEKEGKKVDVVKEEYFKQIKSALLKEKKFSRKLDPKSIMTFKDLQKLLVEEGVKFGLDLLLSAVPGGTFVTKLIDVIYNSIKGAAA